MRHILVFYMTELDLWAGGQSYSLHHHYSVCFLHQADERSAFTLIQSDLQTKDIKTCNWLKIAKRTAEQGSRFENGFIILFCFIWVLRCFLLLNFFTKIIIFSIWMHFCVCVCMFFLTKCNVFYMIYNNSMGEGFLFQFICPIYF